MNKCQKCQKARATVLVTDIDLTNHKPQQLHLCEDCARETGMAAALSPSAAEMLKASILSVTEKESKARSAQRVMCEQCGLSYQEFRVKGRFGCSGCYEAFSDLVEPLLEKVHGAKEYKGPAPKKPSSRRKTTSVAEFEKELVDLRRKLTRAVKSEDYEDAARLRDRITEVERRIAELQDG
jgi:protein arginine kinase activator